MLLPLLLLLAALVVACLVALYVAYPHRGEEMPVAPRVGVAMKQAADAIPVLDGDRGARGSGGVSSGSAGRG